MKRILIFLCFTVFILSGCKNYEKLQIESFNVRKADDIAFLDGKLSADLFINAKIYNPTSSKYSLKKFTASLYLKNKRKFADILSDQDNRATILPHSCDTVSVKLKMIVSNPLAALSLKGLTEDELKKEEMTLDFEFIVKQGIFVKKIKKKEIPIEELVERLKSGIK